MNLKVFISKGFIILIIFFIRANAGAQDFVSTQKTNKNIVFQSRLSADELKNAPIKLIPYPQKVGWGKEQLAIVDLQVVRSKQLTNLLHEEVENICAENGIQLRTSSEYQLEFSYDNKLSEEGYKLEVTKKGIHISSSNETGHYYALQTLRQLILKDDSTSYLQLCLIEDEPAYSIRGYMIDVGRNFQSIVSLKRQLDIMARYKMNIFHWHLTDRPAWRIESKMYPELTDGKNHRPSRNPGKYYTYEEIRELIEYANEKHITVLPEIDMPGHSDSFRKSMGCRMESAEGMMILQNVLNEFFYEIPKKLAPMIHIGSDEVHIQNPEEFITKMISIVESNDRKVIIWSPGLEAKNSVIRQTWGSADAVQGDFQEIDSRRSYINSCEPMTQINKLLFKPIGADSKNKILGGIICLWPDVNVYHENDVFSQNPVYTSLLTYAWSTWTADIESSPVKYRTQVPPHGTEEGDYFKAFELFLLEHKYRYFENEPFPYVAQSDKYWKLIGPFDQNDGDDILIDDEKQSYEYKGKKIVWIPAIGNTLVMKERWTNGGYFPDGKSGQVIYAQTYIHSDEERDIEAWINFETPTRSNRVYSGIAKNGKWDPNGGMIIINNKKLSGPRWNNPGWKTTRQEGWGLPIEQEIPWEDEELYWLRKPVKLHLKKGWNKVLAKIPCMSNFQNWMFTFIPLNMNGIRFSTHPY